MVEPLLGAWLPTKIKRWHKQKIGPWGNNIIKICLFWCLIILLYVVWGKGGRSYHDNVVPDFFCSQTQDFFCVLNIISSCLDYLTSRPKSLGNLKYTSTPMELLSGGALKLVSSQKSITAKQYFFASALIFLLTQPHGHLTMDPCFFWAKRGN